MATPSSFHQDLQNSSPNRQPQPSSTTSRRLPPPCWSHDETVALIDAYREKWYSLRRGNLRASHWQEVADTVAVRCANIPQKTSVQCRHKMEKLRKRYRSEIQRAAATPRYNFSWVHFNRMDRMEKGPTAVALPVNTTPIDEEDDEDQENENDDDGACQEMFYPKNVKNVGNGYNPYRNPSRANLVSPTPLTMYSKFDGYSTPNPSSIPNFGNFKNGYMEKNGTGNERMGKRKENNDPAADLVGAIKALGDGFVRMERMKMDTMREVEAMRMEMEVKKTEMILGSQQRILESFANAVSERKNKKAKRIPSPET